MKKIKFSLMAIVAMTAMVYLNACSGEEGDDIKPTPNLELIGGSGYVASDITLEVESPFTFGINVTSSVRLEKLEITRNIGGTINIPANCSACDSSLSDKTLRVDVDFTTGTSTGTEIYTITVTDKDGGSTSKDITITVVEAGSDLEEITADDNGGETLKVYNFLGPQLGAFDLLQGLPLSSGDPDSDKDIQDSTTNAELNAWPGRWTSRNGSTFKKLGSGYTWDNIKTDVALKAAWDDNTDNPESFLTVEDGDLLAIKLRGGDTYCLIEILEVVQTSNNNNDYVAFQYKRPMQ
jgi:hypothetical protein